MNWLFPLLVWDTPSSSTCGKGPANLENMQMANAPYPWYYGNPEHTSNVFLNLGMLLPWLVSVLVVLLPSFEGTIVHVTGVFASTELMIDLSAMEDEIMAQFQALHRQAVAATDTLGRSVKLQFRISIKIVE